MEALDQNGQVNPFSDKFIILASLGQRGLERRGLKKPAEAHTTAIDCRCSIPCSYQSIAASISEQTT
jgi:hypothetical protein